MNRIKNVTKQTNNPFLNMYEFQVELKSGKTAPYYVASRSQTIEGLEAISHDSHKSDGVIIYGVYGYNKDKVVLVREFRYPLNDYIYHFPAGLVEKGEDLTSAAIREMFEETGLSLTPIDVDPSFTKPFYTTAGMSDESCSTVFGYCTGTPSSAHTEETEDIQVILADKNECRRIMKEDKVSIMCAYMLMHFINGDETDPLAFLASNSQP